jgi:hypothetical protein
METSENKATSLHLHTESHCVGHIAFPDVANCHAMKLSAHFSYIVHVRVLNIGSLLILLYPA